MDYTDVKQGKDPYADAEATQRHLAEHGLQRIGDYFNQVDLLAGTAHSYVAPYDGELTRAIVNIRTTVTTGGPIPISKNGVAITGLTVVVPDGATAGTEITDSPTSPTFVKAGDLLTAIPDAAFATAGALSLQLEIKR